MTAPALAQWDAEEEEFDRCLSCTRWKLAVFGPFTTPDRHLAFIDRQEITITFCQGCGAIRTRRPE